MPYCYGTMHRTLERKAQPRRAGRKERATLYNVRWSELEDDWLEVNYEQLGALACAEYLGRPVACVKFRYRDRRRRIERYGPREYVAAFPQTPAVDLARLFGIGETRAAFLRCACRL